MKGKIISVAAILLWIITALVVGFRFIAGTSVESKDGRNIITLEASEKALVLAEMRQMLQSVQGIVSGIEKANMKEVAESARNGGTQMMADMNPSLMMKLPLEFKKTGVGVHKFFDEIAKKAEHGAAKEEVLGMLNTQLKSCVGCHAGYQFQVK